MRKFTSTPFWTDEAKPLCQYPWLAQNERCEVLVLGGGLTGAVLAYHFAADGADVCLLTRTPVGYGATAYGTGIMEYDNNLSLVQLGKSIGKQAAVDCLNRYCDALDSIEALCDSLDADVGFARRDALSYTPDGDHGDFFHTEYLIRRHNGFDVEYLDRAAARDRYSFPLEDGILSKGLAAEMDPYRFTQALVQKASKEFGLRCYEMSEATAIDLSGGRVTVQTNTHQTIRADKLVLATGMSQNDYLKLLSGKKAVFTVVTEPVDSFPGYDGRTILRNDAGSGFHIRTTPDDRLIISGSDSLFSGVDRRFAKLSGPARLTELRYEKLMKTLDEMFCGIGGIVPCHCFSGTYGYTADMLPVIGEHEDYQNVYFCMESGPENALTAEIAADLLMRLYHNEPYELKLFSPKRRSLARRAIFGA
ncbi:MAG: NAD(P)/FAD-dependent oxidoreductase [Oscillospiraceae bacterium]|jgi:glycine/D-amino acid oxidase-like deaminating enzyme